jgi:hypothetical protein
VCFSVISCFSVLYTDKIFSASRSNALKSRGPAVTCFTTSAELAGSLSLTLVWTEFFFLLEYAKKTAHLCSIRIKIKFQPKLSGNYRVRPHVKRLARTWELSKILLLHFFYARWHACVSLFQITHPFYTTAGRF